MGRQGIKAGVQGQEGGEEKRINVSIQMMSERSFPQGASR